MGLKQLRFCLLVVGILGFASTTKADTVAVNGSYSFASNGYGIPPYGGTLTSGGVTQSEQFYCVDFTHDITGGMSWNVTTTSLSGSDFSSTLLWSKLGSASQNTYLAMAYLVTQMMGITQMDPASLLQKAEDQFAIWSLTGGPDPYGTDGSIVAAAIAAVQATGFNGAGFEILTPTGSTGQEFLVNTPEPSTLSLLVFGLLGLMIVGHRKLNI